MNAVRALLLAAGLGTRLAPFTDRLPKCLMPVGGIPLLEHWLYALHCVGIPDVLVNVHHHRDMVDKFLQREVFKNWVSAVYESDLLGTAGTLRTNSDFFRGQTIFLAHADNWCQCDLKQFLYFHNRCRPIGTLITMMTFRTDAPGECGIVTLNDSGIVKEFIEKSKDPHGNLANGAVYLLEPEVLAWIKQQSRITDFSTEVLPHYMGRIATWENTNVHRDIGSINNLLKAQTDAPTRPAWAESDEWSRDFSNHPIHKDLEDLHC